MTVNDGDIIGKKFLILDGTASNSGDIHTAGGDDGIAVIQNTLIMVRLELLVKIVVVLILRLHHLTLNLINQY